MEYTRGVKGPASTNEIEIQSFEENPSANLVKGTGILRKKNGELRGVTFLAQGKHYEALKPMLMRDMKIVSQVRWTGSTAVTLIGVQPLTDEQRADFNQRTDDRLNAQLKGRFAAVDALLSRELKAVGG